MSANQDGRSLIRQYLLGELIGDSQQKMEDRLMKEVGLLEELEVEEDELIDDYLRGKLSVEERAAFESQFLATGERQRKFRFAQSLKRFVATTSGERSSPSGIVRPGFFTLQRPTLYAVAAVVVAAVIVSALWLYVGRKRAQSLVAINLTLTTANRSTGIVPTKVKLPKGSDGLLISLQFPDPLRPGESVRLELINDNGETIPMKTVAQDTHTVSVEIASAQLQPMQYAIRVFVRDSAGAERRINGNYFFTVE